MTAPRPPAQPAPIARALLSVTDKTGLADFARFLSRRGVELLSTGGTAKVLADAGIAVKEVAEHTGFPEILGGRVKTLHPAIHAGILWKRDEPVDASEEAALRRFDMTPGGFRLAPIDLVAVNLYPFEETMRSGAGRAECIENIDIGGPAMVRAAAKNHAWVTVVTDPADYGEVAAEMEAMGGATTPALRERLALKAFAHTAAYDAAIAEWLGAGRNAPFPERLVVAGRLAATLRYGENPHQRAALYLAGEPRPGAARALRLQGKDLSYNNLADADAAFELVAEFDRPAIAIVKHGNPCGVARAATLADAYRRALACDPVSAFGGIVAANRTLDEDTAAAIAELFAEVVIAPGIDDGARRVLAAKKALRVLATGATPLPGAEGRELRSLAGGFLLQTRDSLAVGEADLKVVTKKRPTREEVRDLRFALAVVKHVKSNGVVLARGGATVGIGAGQMSRVDAARIAAHKAKEAAAAAGERESRSVGAVAASDAFLPFADGLVVLAEAGVRALVQPGGAKRDREVIAAADEHGLAMVFTGVRHFRH